MKKISMGGIKKVMVSSVLLIVGSAHGNNSSNTFILLGRAGWMDRKQVPAMGKRLERPERFAFFNFPRVFVFVFVF